MALVFREVNNIMWWDFMRTSAESWLAQNELRGDALKSLASKDNTLSVYLLSNEDGESLERVITAFAAQRPKLSTVDFALLEASHLETNGFVLETLEGNTPDPVVNTWHRDLVRLSGARILQLANGLQRDAVFCRRRRAAVKQMIRHGIDAGWIDKTRMQKDILDEVAN